MDEKGIQVELMRDIYRTASRVHVWLGMDKPEWGLACAFSFLETVINAVEDVEIDPDRPSLRGLLPVWEVFDVDCYEHLFHLLRHPWFS